MNQETRTHKVVREVPVRKFLRSSMKRGPEESFEAYKISRKAHNKAMKMILKYGSHCLTFITVDAPMLPMHQEEPDESN